MPLWVWSCFLLFYYFFIAWIRKIYVIKKSCFAVYFYSFTCLFYIVKQSSACVGLVINIASAWLLIKYHLLSTMNEDPGKVGKPYKHCSHPPTYVYVIRLLYSWKTLSVGLPDPIGDRILAIEYDHIVRCSSAVSRWLKANTLLVATNKVFVKTWCQAIFLHCVLVYMFTFYCHAMFASFC